MIPEYVPPRWWDSGTETPVNHLIALPRNGPAQYYESAFVGFFGLGGAWAAFTQDRAVLGARIGFALWTAMQRARRGPSGFEVELGRVLARARAEAEAERDRLIDVMRADAGSVDAE